MLARLRVVAEDITQRTANTREMSRIFNPVRAPGLWALSVVLCLETDLTLDGRFESSHRAVQVMPLA